MKEKRCREEACFTCGHYHDFEGGEPCSVCGHVIADAGVRASETVMPSAIVPGFLYLGSYDTASRQELLKAMNMSHILNTVSSCQPLYQNTFIYHTCSGSQPDFAECFQFLDEVNALGSRVLVHCMSGRSRAPTVVTAYMMKLRGWRLAEAYKWVKDKRPSINITPDDTKRLTDYEMQLHGSCSVPFGLAAVNLPGALPSTSLQQVQLQLPFTQHSQQQHSGTPLATSVVCAPSTDPNLSGIKGSPSFTFGSGGGSSSSNGFVFGQKPQ